MRFRMKRSVPFDVESAVVGFYARAGREREPTLSSSRQRSRLLRDTKALRAAGAFTPVL